MRPRLFHDLLGSAHEALEHAQGKRALHTTELPAPPTPMTTAEVRAMREQVNASQAVFARYLNVSTKLVQAWESGRRTPDGAALRLLRLGGEHPLLVFTTSSDTNATNPRSKLPDKEPAPHGAAKRKPRARHKAMGRQPRER